MVVEPTAHKCNVCLHRSAHSRYLAIKGNEKDDDDGGGDGDDDGEDADDGGGDGDHVD